MFVLILGHFWCSVVTSVKLGSNLSNFEKKKKTKNFKDQNSQQFFFNPKISRNKTKNPNIQNKNPKNPKKSNTKKTTKSEKSIKKTHKSKNVKTYQKF